MESRQELRLLLFESEKTRESSPFEEFFVDSESKAFRVEYNSRAHMETKERLQVRPHETLFGGSFDLEPELCPNKHKLETIFISLISILVFPKAPQYFGKHEEYCDQEQNGLRYKAEPGLLQLRHILRR